MRHLTTIGLFIIIIMLSIIIIRPGLQSTESIAAATVSKQKIIDRQRGKLIKQIIARRTVLITREMDEERTYIGSGTIISSDGYILSAVHVMRWQSDPTMVVHLGTGEKINAANASVIDFDSIADLLLIKLNDTNTIYDASPILDATAAANLSSGDNLLLSGHAYGLTNPLVSECKFLSVVEHEETGTPVIWFDWFAAPGDSGGGLYNANGALIGAFHSVGGKDGFSRFGRAASNEVTRKFLDKNHVQYTTMVEFP